MKFLILVLSVAGVVLARPSGFGPLLRFSDDGGSFSYSYQTPAVQLLQPVQRAHFVQSAHLVQPAHFVQPHSLIVGPSVSYNYGVSSASVKTVDPANIQISNEGFVIDTPEVANARAEHLALVAQQAARVGASSEEEIKDEQNAVDDDTVEVKAVKSTVEPANIQLSADGQVLETPEVARARAEHLALFAAEATRAAANPESAEDVQINSNDAQYIQPVPAVKSYEIANIQLSADGHVLETAEVAQARAEHLARFAVEAANAAANPETAEDVQVNSNGAGNIQTVFDSAPAAVKSYEIANIQLSADGHVLETAEVAQARAEHLARFQAEAANAAANPETPEDVQINNNNIVTRFSYQPIQVFAPAQQYAVPPYNSFEFARISADGQVLETAEVAQAKAEHFARFQAEAANAAANPETPEDVQINNAAGYRYVQPIPVYSQAPVVVPTIKSYEIANIQLSADGHVLDTPEVAQAKAEHLARFAQEAAKASVNNDVSYRFIQPINVVEPAPIKAFEAADIKVSADGHVLDTIEVAQAKAAHFAQFEADAARAVAAGGDQSDLSEGSSGEDNSVSVVAVRTDASPSLSVAKIDDAPADIKISADGFVLDTPEVAQAKSEHLAKLAIAGVTSDDGSSDEAVSVVAASPSYLAYTSPSVAYTGPVAYSADVQPKWTGPEADIKVGADGFVIDTQEVQQARAEHLSQRSAALANAKSSEWSGAVARYAQAGEYLQDTPEVAAARAAHLEAYAKEAARASSSAKTWSNYGQLVYSAPYYRSAVPVAYYAQPHINFLSYRYAPAQVALTADGQYLLDTPEVAAAKAEHFQAHARAIRQ